MRPFGHDHLPRALRICLRFALGAFTINSGSLIQRLDLPELVGTGEWAAEGKVVWFRFVVEGRTHYLNILPGEYSEKEPQGEDVLIIDRQISEKRKPGMIDGLYGYARSLDRGMLSTETLLLIDTLGSKLEQDEEGQQLDVRPFLSAAQVMQNPQSREQVERTFQDLFETCYYNYRMPLDHFSECILSVRLQLEMDLWMQGDGYTDPWPFINGFVRQIGLDHPHLLERLSGLGDHYFEEASLHLSAALKAGGVELYLEKIRMAAHHYYCALLVARAVNVNELFVLFAYTELIAEEGWACTISGMSNFSFYFNKLDYYPRLIAQGLRLNGASFEGVFYRKNSSPTHPYLPRLIIRILVAYGKVLAGPLFKEEGLRELKEAEVNAAGIAGFDLCLVELALLQAAKFLNEDALLQTYATKLAAKIAVSAGLGE